MDIDNIRGIFFDLHGTIMLSPDLSAAWERWSTALHTSMAKHGLSTSKEELIPHLKLFFESPEPSSWDDGLSLYERRLEDLGCRLGLDLDRETIRGMVTYTIEAWYSDMYVDPEAHGVLEALKSRFKTGLITNWDHAPSIYRILADYKLEGYFETVVVSDEVGVAKPDPRIFDIALRDAGLRPEEVAYVGDAPEDVEGSLAAGLHPVLVRRKDEARDTNPPGIHSRPFDENLLGLSSIQVITRLGTLLKIFRLETRTNRDTSRMSRGTAQSEDRDPP